MAVAELGRGRVDDILAVIAARPDKMAALDAVAALGLPDCWIGAGFVRALVWDILHEFAQPTQIADVDVIYFDPGDCSRAAESEIEAALNARLANVPWSVRNQARMHLGKPGEAPYSNTWDAVAKWVETPTAVAARLDPDGGLALLAPHGITDLVGLIVRPTPHFWHRPVPYMRRLAAKRWPETWPRLRVLYR